MVMFKERGFVTKSLINKSWTNKARTKHVTNNH